MSADDNKAALRRFYEEVLNGGNLEVADQLLAPDAVDHTLGSRGLQAYKQFLSSVHQAFPDMRVEVHDMIAEGDLVATRVTYSGTHQGEFLGVPATGRRIEVSGVDFLRMRDGRQAEHWGGPDMAGLLQQLGVIPAPGTSA
jgi:steroid delta-isomerase-like uncharacterized protein